MKETSITVLSDTFDLYMQKGKEAKSRGNIALARRNFLLASETMMQMAKQSSGNLKKVRMDRARRLAQIADSLEKQPVKTEKKTDDSEDDDVKKWQTAQIPNIKFSDVAGLDEVKRAITIKMINPVKYPDKYKCMAKRPAAEFCFMAHREQERQ